MAKETHSDTALGLPAHHFPYVNKNSQTIPAPTPTPKHYRGTHIHTGHKCLIRQGEVQRHVL